MTEETFHLDEHIVISNEYMADWDNITDASQLLGIEVDVNSEEYDKSSSESDGIMRFIKRFEKNNECISDEEYFDILS